MKVEMGERLEDAIRDRDLKKIRGIIGTRCYVSGDFSDVEEIIRYVQKKGIKESELFEELKGTTISSQKSNYTDKDFADAVFELKENFCRERVEDVKTIGKALHRGQKQQNKNQEKKETQKTTKTGKIPRENSGGQSSKKVCSHPEQNQTTNSKQKKGMLQRIIQAIKEWFQKK